MNKIEALKLHNGDEVQIKKTGEITTVLQAYKEGNSVIIETTYNGFTKFYADEII